MATAPQANLQALIEEEFARTMAAEEAYGSFATMAVDGLGILNSFIASISPTKLMAAAALSSIQKHMTLAFLSYVRLHIVQADFNSRRAIEYTSICAYLLTHDEPEKAITVDGNGKELRSPKAISGTAYKWMDQNLPEHSRQLAEAKDFINDSTAHASIPTTDFTFDWDGIGADSEVAKASFFDAIDPDMVRFHLTGFTRLVYLILRTIIDASTANGDGFRFPDDIEARITVLFMQFEIHRNMIGKAMGFGE